MALPNWLFDTWPGAFLIAFPSLFSIVDPLGNAIIISQLTGGWAEAERRHLARKVALLSLLLLMGALWVGAHFLNFFGVTIGALRVAGGLVIAMAGWQLLNGEEQQAALSGGGQWNSCSAARQLGSSAATVAVVALVWLFYRHCGVINRVLGKGGSRVVSRLIALIVLAIGVQILGAGIHELLTTQIPESEL